CIITIYKVGFIMDVNRKVRFALGIIVLLLVDIIWVGSSELSRFIFNESGYNKPFFSTYVKTSMFTLYLFGFLFCKSWRHQCITQNNTAYQVVDMSPEEEIRSQETSSLVGEQEKSSDSDDSSVKSVRFSRMTEVRHMAESEAVDAMLSRLSFTASLKAEQIVKDTAMKFSIITVMKISLIFCLMWFLGNYGYQEALSLTEVGVVNVISSTSGLFTLILASLFPSSSADKFSLSKLTAVLFIILGTALISIEELKLDGTTFPVGVMWSFVGALFYAFYMVFLKRQVPSEEKMDLPMFFGFVGLFNAIILWPGFFILNATGLEVFQVPTKQQLLYIILNGLVGTVLSELLWLWGCFLTSSLMATLSLTLTIPMTMLCDIFLKGVVYSWHFYVGSIPVLFAFIAVTFLTHYEDKDPVLDGFKFFVRFCCKRKKDYR
ncbi:Solute carrier family 35 member F5, partial [Armadillidium nasatum]